MSDKKNVFEKINKAIELIRTNEIKKDGKNDFSHYDYFTPSMVDTLVYNGTKNLGLFIKFDTLATEKGVKGVLQIINTEDLNDVAIFEMALDVPQIKATNIAQQYGGLLTYGKRYLLMNTFMISDNKADFDSQDNRKKANAKPQIKKPNLEPMTENWNKALDYLRGGGTIQAIKTKYNLTSVNEKALQTEL